MVIGGTVMLRLRVVDPPGPVAVTTTAKLPADVGVPVMAPELALMFMPVGRELGGTEKLVTGPPRTLDTSRVAGAPSVQVGASSV